MQRKIRKFSTIVVIASMVTAIMFIGIGNVAADPATCDEEKFGPYADTVSNEGHGGPNEDGQLRITKPACDDSARGNPVEVTDESDNWDSKCFISGEGASQNDNEKQGSVAGHCDG